MGSCYHYQGTDETNINLALDCFLKANKIKPRNSLANNLIGYFYMVKNNIGIKKKKKKKRLKISKTYIILLF